MVDDSPDKLSLTVVISQSMYFPWCGFLDQIRLADIFVHYDDVQLSRGFYNRVQVKTSQGISWLTVPILDRNKRQNINECRISYEEDWLAKHRAILVNAYRKAKFFEDMISLFDSVHSTRYKFLHELTRSSIFALVDYFELNESTRFVSSEDLSISGKGSQRLLDITQAVAGSVYLTGHGALNYLDHTLFDERNIEVSYMQYKISPYEQFSGKFTPYVTALDAIAHLGKGANQILNSGIIDWRSAIERVDTLRPLI